MPSGHVMNVMHVCWPICPTTTWAGRLSVWIERGVELALPGDGAGGESPERSAPSANGASAARRNGAARARGATAEPSAPCTDARLSPLALPAADLSTVLAPLNLGVAEQPAVAWLPTAGGQPLPSPQASEQGWDAAGAAALAPWRLPVAEFPIRELVGWLSGLADGGLIRLGGTLLRPASDLLWWRALARLAQCVLDRERYVPAVGRNASGVVAWWRALLDEHGLSRPLQRLAEAMPPSAILPVLERADAAPRLSDPAWVARRFVESAVDAVVRAGPRPDHLDGVDDEDLPIGPALTTALFAPRIETAHVRVDDALRQKVLDSVTNWTANLVEPSADLRLCLQLTPPDLGDEPETTGKSEKKKGKGNGSRNGGEKTAGKASAGAPAATVAASANAEWHLGFFLQPSSDASLLIPAAEVWSGHSAALASLPRLERDPQDVLLAELARVSRICPLLERALQERHPLGCTLSTAEAHHFLKDQAGLLQEAGVVVRLPTWWNGTAPGGQLALRLHLTPVQAAKGEAIHTQAASHLTLDTLVNFNWQVALGDLTLTEGEFERLVSLKSPLVHIRGSWVELSTEQLEIIQKLLNDQSAKTGTLRTALQMGLGAGEFAVGKLGELPEELAAKVQIAGVTSEGWIAPQLDRLLGEQATCLEAIAPPPEFVGSLRPYQGLGLSWLVFLRRVGLGALLADDMGLGKTVQMLAALQHWKNERGAAASAAALPGPEGLPASPAGAPAVHAPTLLVAPTSVVANWRREAERFTPQLGVLVHQGQDRLRGEAFARRAGQADLVVTSYSLVQRDFDLLSPIPWSTLVLDEAQAIKNTGTKTTQAVKALRADYRVALTGTPVENRLSELWSICEFLNPSYLGSAAGFRRQFISPIEKNRDPAAAAKLRRLVAPLLLRRVKTDRRIISDLPDKIESTVYCKLTREQATLYEAIVKDSLSEIGKASGMARKGAVLAAITRLKQVCNHPAHYLGDYSAVGERSGKINRLVEMLEEVLDSGDRALLFTQFTEFGHLVRVFLEERFGREVLFLHGGTPPTIRERMVERFQSAVISDAPVNGNGGGHDEDAQANLLGDAPPVFLLSLKAGGTGLNLTAANHVFHLDRWWNPAVESQATDRAFRIGQKRSVQVHKFVCEGTLEERIDQMLESKKELAAAIVTSGEEWITELTTDQLKELFALRDTAVE